MVVWTSFLVIDVRLQQVSKNMNFFFSDCYPLTPGRCSVTNHKSGETWTHLTEVILPSALFRLNRTCGLDSVPVCVYASHIELHPVTLHLLRLQSSFPVYLFYPAYLHSINIFIWILCCTQITLGNDLSFPCCTVTEKQPLLRLSWNVCLAADKYRFEYHKEWVICQIFIIHNWKRKWTKARTSKRTDKLNIGP